MGKSRKSGKANLAAVHGMVGNLYQAATSENHIEAHGLRAEQVGFFQENGYLAPVRVLDEEQIGVMRNGLERMIADDYARRGELIDLSAEAGVTKDEQLIYFQGAWTVEEAFHDIVFHAGVTVPLHQLLGTERVRFLHDQVFYKPARHGGVVAWHQDYSYWTRTTPAGHVTCFIALDDTTLENGCMHVAPGSHRWDLLPEIQLKGDIDEMEALRKVLTAEQSAAFRPVAIQLRAGEASFHHCLIVHGSYPNTSDHPRRGLVLNYMKPDTRSSGERAIMPGAEIAEGEIIEGDLFPLVIDVGHLVN